MEKLWNLDYMAETKYTTDPCVSPNSLHFPRDIHITNGDDACKKISKLIFHRPERNFSSKVPYKSWSGSPQTPKALQALRICRPTHLDGFFIHSHLCLASNIVDSLSCIWINHIRSRYDWRRFGWHDWPDHYGTSWRGKLFTLRRSVCFVSTSYNSDLFLSLTRCRDYLDCVQRWTDRPSMTRCWRVACFCGI